LPRVRVPVHWKAFVLFPALNGAYGGLQVTGDPLPRVEPDTARGIHDTKVTIQPVNHRSAVSSTPASAGETTIDDTLRHAPFAA
jgi:hypothetical protein